MSQDFLNILTTELKKHPQLRKLSEAHMKAIADAFDSWDEIVAYDAPNFVAVFAETETPFTELQASSLIAKARAEAQNKSTIEVETTVAVSAPAANGMFGAWEAQREGPASLAGFTANQINAAWKQSNVFGFGRGAGIVLMASGGVDLAVADMVKSRASGKGQKLNDEALRTLMFQYKRALMGNDFLGEAELEGYTSILAKTLDARDMLILAAFAAIYNQKATSSILGAGASINVGDTKLSPQAMLDGLARICQKVDDAASRSDFGEAMTFLVEGQYEKYILPLLRNLMFQRLMGVLEPNEAEPNITAIEALKTQHYDEAGDFLLAGMRATEMFRRIGMFDPNAPLDPGFFAFVGEAIAAYLSAAQNLNLESAEEVAEKANLPFRSDPAPVANRSETRETSRGWKINIFFGVRITR